ncbi:MAG TPA: hypothetical protein DDZ51_25980 [Planctomycetaceae bacterium]|nr:hypothetical protein [Planctomycetaceae bacterium]
MQGATFADKSMMRPIFSVHKQRIEVCWSPRNICPLSVEHERWIDEIRDSFTIAPLHQMPN